MKVQKTASIYFAFQGIAVIAWWCLLVFVPASRAYFKMGSSEYILLAFWLPDLFFLGIGSLAAAYFLRANHKFTSIAVWFVVGTISYAAIYCLSFALFTDSGWLGVVFMLPAMLWSGVFAVGIPPVSDHMFRQTKAAGTNWILTKTFSQIVVVWSMILVVFPYIITWVEAKIGIPNLEFSYQKPIAVLLFIAISSIGVSSAYTMSKNGKGTPLPLDHAPDLVIKGVYAYIRNPMALSGIGQGIAVALFLGSPLVLIYAVMGSLIWQLIFRPLEEDDLRKRFGKEYEDYCKKVKCWIPNLKAYKPATPNTTEG
ncbi:MAG: isoprenylcysteine carboxylmethyltransferase family protein [Pyrinomonadaceae bacterium]